ncbi:GNAT family N-acetyltransferase [Methanobacterium oryzae]|uniref:GNAT family N-acetyltransferase n=1 Tax=Methanobacterium oryzae TaxID=69540 RepID=UPI003D25F35E
MNINYIALNKEEINKIKPLWNNLRDYHSELSTHFQERYKAVKFEDRKEEILKKSENGILKIDLVEDKNNSSYVGYCISSISEENVGEVDSIYLNEKYRSSGIGSALMERALNWMDKNGVKTKKIVVAVGNEELLSFYKRYNFFPRHLILEKR